MKVYDNFNKDGQTHQHSRMHATRYTTHTLLLRTYLLPTGARDRCLALCQGPWCRWGKVGISLTSSNGNRGPLAGRWGATPFLSGWHQQPWKEHAFPHSGSKSGKAFTFTLYELKDDAGWLTATSVRGSERGHWPGPGHMGRLP